MIVAEDKAQNRWRVRHESHRKHKQFVVVFTKRWVKRQDPNGACPELLSKKTFRTKKEARAYAIEKADLADRLAGSFDILKLSQQSQILGLASELVEYDTDAITLLQEALRICKLSLDPIESMTQGKALIQLAEDNSDKTIGFFMDRYFEDPGLQKAETKTEIISNLKHNFKALREHPVGILINPKKAREVIQPVLQAYCDRPDVTRLSALRTQQSRLRQLLSYIQKQIGIPTGGDLDEMTNLEKYSLNHDLLMPREDYALSAGEILVMMKWFFRAESWCPYYPILAALMGTRFKLFNELKWSHFGGKGRLANSTVKIPRDLLKTVRQGKTTRSATFKTSAIPNLENWLWYGLYVEISRGFKKHGNLNKAFIRTLSERRIREERNNCIREWRDYFECSKEVNGDFTWGDVAENGFRNSMISYGVLHEVVKKNVSLITNDYKSHAHYTDTNKPEADLESRILFEMTPMYLELVDLENKTVDERFLYATMEERKEMWVEEEDKYKKEAYKRILESHGEISWEEQKSNPTKHKDSITGHYEGLDNENREFWKNTTEDKLVYLQYHPAIPLKSWVDNQMGDRVEF